MGGSARDLEPFLDSETLLCYTVTVEGGENLY